MESRDEIRSLHFTWLLWFKLKYIKTSNNAKIEYWKFHNYKFFNLKWYIKTVELYFWINWIIYLKAGKIQWWPPDGDSSIDDFIYVFI